MVNSVQPLVNACSGKDRKQDATRKGSLLLEANPSRILQTCGAAAVESVMRLRCPGAPLNKLEM